MIVVGDERNGIDPGELVSVLLIYQIRCLSLLWPLFDSHASGNSIWRETPVLSVRGVYSNRLARGRHCTRPTHALVWHVVIPKILNVFYFWWKIPLTLSYFISNVRNNCGLEECFNASFRTISAATYIALTLLVGLQEGNPAFKNWEVAGVVWWGADLHMAQLMPLPLTASCFTKSRLPIWYWLTRLIRDKELSLFAPQVDRGNVLTRVCLCFVIRIHENWKIMNGFHKI